MGIYSGAKKSSKWPKTIKILTFLIIKIIQFQRSANFFIQLLSPDMVKLLGNKSQAWGSITDPFGGLKRLKINQNEAKQSKYSNF